MTTAAAFAPSRFQLTRHTTTFWRVTFDNGPLNLIDGQMNLELHHLLDLVEQDDQVAVVLFDSNNPDYFLAHYAADADMSPLDALEPKQATPWLYWATFLVRLSTSPAVTITALRGRARGAGSEFALATDIRFASRERGVLGQFEVGLGVMPGGAPSTRLAGLVGRGRAFEIVLGGEDFDGDLAERYGYVNRAIPDAEFVEFVDAYAQRVSRFDRRALGDIKGFINAASLPDEIAVMAEIRAFGEAVSREPATRLIPAAFQAGWGQPGDFELHLGTRIAELTATD
ncbi:enoyl-CoA hydratase/isomerase family protein [Streptomyces misionensis]|uniref:enoyl-CoA hydratase/isomerase family protein n=1 Tax=Streptomyces misionensis TaxID=67331 RepID=UPI0033C9C7DE